MTLSTLFDKNIIVGQDFTILSKAEGLAVLTNLCTQIRDRINDWIPASAGKTEREHFVTLSGRSPVGVEA